MFPLKTCVVVLSGIDGFTRGSFDNSDEFIKHKKVHNNNIFLKGFDNRKVNSFTEVFCKLYMCIRLCVHDYSCNMHHTPMGYTP